MISGPTIHQQQNFNSQTNRLRKAGTAAAPPKLSVEESSMIKKNFSTAKPVKLYDIKGGVSEHNFGDRGMNVDTRV
jgi:hypothetical protein